jgi:hypothetical protein
VPAPGGAGSSRPANSGDGGDDEDGGVETLEKWRAAVRGAQLAWIDFCESIGVSPEDASGYTGDEDGLLGFTLEMLFPDGVQDVEPNVAIRSGRLAALRDRWGEKTGA